MAELKRKTDNDNFWLTISSQIVRAQINAEGDASEEVTQAIPATQK